MPIDPQNPSINYKKYRTAPSYEVAFQSAPNTDVSVIPTISEVPEELAVTQLSFSSNPTTGFAINYRVAIVANFADNLQSGIHSLRFRINYSRSQQFVNPVYEDYFEYVVLNLIVTDTLVLALDPNNMYFQHIIGQNPPESKILGISTENNWTATKDQSWITLPTTSGSESSNVLVGVDVTGLPVGNYQGQVLVDDSYDQKILNVFLTVTGEDGQTDFLIVDPQELAFSEIFTQDPTGQRSFSVESSINFTITTDLPWLQLSASSGTAGVSQVTVNTQNTQGLSIGSYDGVITVQSAVGVKNIFVALFIVRSDSGGLISGGFFYANDRNRVTLASNLDDMEMVVEHTNSLSLMNYIKSAPFYKGNAYSVIGIEANDLLRSNNLLASIGTGIINPVTPMELFLKVYDKPIDSSAQELRETFENLKFINGRTPEVEDRLSYIPKKVYVTSDAIVSLSFRSDDIPSSIEISGAVTMSIPLTIGDQLVYTAFIDLKDLSLSPWDTIKIQIGPFEVDVVIKEYQPESTLLVFENEWNCPETIMLNGFLENEKQSKNTTTTVLSEGMYHERIIDQRFPYEYMVDTGYLYTDQEVKWVSRLLDSKKVHLMIDGEFKEVIPLTKKMSIFRTRRNVSSYQLKFKAAVT